MSRRDAWSPVVLLMVLAADGLAQTSEVVLEVGGSQLRPPVEVDGVAARFVVGGIRAQRFAPGGTGVWGAALAGRALDGAHGADFLSGDLGAAAWLPLDHGVSLGMEARGFAFEVANPYLYRAGGAEGSLGLRVSGPAVMVRVAATGGLGRSRVELRRYVDGPARIFTDDLWRYGGEAELLVGGRALAVGAAGSVHETAGGMFRSVGGRVVVALAGSAVEVRLDAWDTPAGAETTGGLSLVVPLGAWVVRGFGGRAAPDPLTLADPGRGGGGLMVGRRVVGLRPGGRPDLFEIGAPVDGGAGVRFRLVAPGAGTVNLLGDFTLWDPVAMARVGDAWTVTVHVPAGVHHFGFLVDGAWHVPEDAPDLVPDEWGRKNATLVVEANDAAGLGPGAEGAVR